MPTLLRMQRSFRSIRGLHPVQPICEALALAYVRAGLATYPTLTHWRCGIHLSFALHVAAGRTPWVIVMVHAPPYHTYFHHYKEMECFLDNLEEEFFTFGVDLVLSGHIHAYERTHGMYKCVLPLPLTPPHLRSVAVANACV